MASAAIDACFVCGGRYHDIDYARLRILGLLAEEPRIRTRVAEDYRDIAVIERSRFLVTCCGANGSRAPLARSGSPAPGSCATSGCT